MFDSKFILCKSTNKEVKIGDYTDAVDYYKSTLNKNYLNSIDEKTLLVDFDREIHDGGYIIVNLGPETNVYIVEQNHLQNMYDELLGKHERPDIYEDFQKIYKVFDRKRKLNNKLTDED
jgi:hypothetical protein